METFVVEDEFLLDGKPVKLLSGAIHYFRMIPRDWEHSLYNLKALGFNAVETYIPWNLHEMKEGVFDFEGIKDVSAFIQKAGEMGLMVIARPSPYICAEWDFGGLPAWLLNEADIRVRTTDQVFIEKVDAYYKVLMEKLTPLQITNGGPIIMMQIENEYGSFGNDAHYLKAIRDIMIKYGVNVPLFTSDGGWLQALEAGSICELNVIPTANFGSDAQSNFDDLETFMALKGKKWPLMCMEFWDGWFNLWGEAIIRRDGDDVAKEALEVLKRGSINLYMFHGGSNFGFFNGCTDEAGVDKPQVTTYDYDALLTEWGDPTEKYFAVARMVKDLMPHIQQLEPRYKKRKTYGDISLVAKTSLFTNLDNIAQKIESSVPLTMEKAGSGYGYILYRTVVKGFDQLTKLKLVETSDRAHIYKDETLVATQYQSQIGEALEVQMNEQNQIDVLVENLGRVNYGPKLYAPSQRKGMRSGLMVDIHFHSHWHQYAFDLALIDRVDYDLPWKEGVPAFYKYEFETNECCDTFLDVSGLGKGVVFVNGFHLGRYWDVGPVSYLYVPGGILKNKNVLEVFETEGKIMEKLRLVDQPVYKKMHATDGVQEVK